MRTRIRLAYVVDSMEIGGSELNAVRTLEGLDRDRFDLTLFHLGQSGPLVPRYTALGLPLIPVPIRGFLHSSFVRSGRVLATELRLRQIQILHSHDIYSNIFAIPWGLLARTPVLIASKRWHKAVPSRLHRTANRLATRSATRVLANSLFVARTLAEEDGVAADRIQVIPNFLTPDAFAPGARADRDALYARLGIPRTAIVVGVVARLSPIKGQEVAIDAFARLAAGRPDTHLLLIGEGPSRESLEAQVRALRLDTRVHFAGRLAGPGNLHDYLDISVLPSLSEGSPNALIEAMAAGRPVVASAVGGVPDAIEHDVTGLLVSPGDPERLAGALTRLLERPDLAARLGGLAREAARSSYSSRTVLGLLMNWYESLVPAVAS